MYRVPANKENDDPPSSCILTVFYIAIIFLTLITSAWYRLFPDIKYVNVDDVGYVWMKPDPVNVWMRYRASEWLLWLICSSVLI